jgi:hypothetical protein
MKTLNRFKLLLIAVFVLNGLIAMANNGAPTNTVNSSTEKTIKDYFRFPQILLPHADDKVIENKVEVIFTTSENGRVNFVLAKTNDPILKKEIEKQFSLLTLPQLKQEVAHSVVLNFRTM